MEPFKFLSQRKTKFLPHEQNKEVQFRFRQKHLTWIRKKVPLQQKKY